MGAYSRAKGARAERELCRLLSDYLGGKYSRNLKQFQQAQLGDIEQTVGPYLVECKNHATLAIPSWWRQACAAAEAAGAVPCLAIKIARKGWRFIVPLPEARASGASWRYDLAYTMELAEEGFFLHVRELGG